MRVRIELQGRLHWPLIAGTIATRRELVTQLLQVTQELVLRDSMARAQTASRYESHLTVLNKQSLTAGKELSEALDKLHFT